MSIVFGVSGQYPHSVVLEEGFHIVDALWRLFSDPACAYDPALHWTVAACPRVFPDRAGRALVLLTLSALDPASFHVWIDIRTDSPLLMAAQVGVGRSSAEIIDRFFPGRSGLLLYVDGALAGDTPALRHGCVLTICRKPWDCITWPLSRMFTGHPSLRLLQFPFSLPRAVLDLAQARRALAATAIPVRYSRFRADFEARLFAEVDRRVGLVGVVAHQSVLALCSPHFGTSVTSAGFSVAPSSHQLGNFLRETWPEYSRSLVIDSREFFAEKYFYFIVDSQQPLVAWVRTSGDHEDVLFLPPTVHPTQGLLCPQGCHIEVFRHEGSWGLFDVRQGAVGRDPEPFAMQAIDSFQAAEALLSSSSSSLSSDLFAPPTKGVPGPAFSVTAPQGSFSASPELSLSEKRGPRCHDVSASAGQVPFFSASSACELGSGVVSGAAPDDMSPEASVSSESTALLQLGASRKVVSGTTVAGQSSLCRLPLVDAGSRLRHPRCLRSPLPLRLPLPRLREGI